MTSNFCLSDRRFSNEGKLKRPIPYPYYLESDVKEFIKRLKEEIRIIKSPHGQINQILNDIIDKLAGPKLTHSIRNLSPQTGQKILSSDKQGSSSTEATGTTLTSSKRNPVLCSICNYADWCHPVYKGDKNYTELLCDKFTPKQAEEKE